MSLAILFLTLFAGALACLFRWAFRALPAERWQFLACAATRLEPGGQWRGVNFTYYGLFSALAYAAGAALFLVLSASAGATPPAAIAAVALVVAICLPASSWIVRIVERKRHGFTVGGGCFAGFVSAPLVLAAAGWASERYLGQALPLLPTLAAMALGYVAGESVGRLACISFGCCYGKPVSQTRGWARAVGTRFSFVFLGKTKKVAFASKLDGAPLVPIQALTSIVLATLAWLGTALFLSGRAGLAFALAVAGSQIWRIYSETLRADYLGEGKISAYQCMAGAVGAASLAVAALFPDAEPFTPDLARGLAALASPLVILFLEALFALVFWRMGRSAQTGSRISFHVDPERI